MEQFQINTLKYSVQRKSFTFFWLLLGSSFHAAQMHRQETVRCFRVKGGAAKKLMLYSLWDI